MPHLDRTPAEWFEEASRWYVERHQGCPWCGGSYRVYVVKRPGQVEYFCGACDFQAIRYMETGKFSSIPGEEIDADAPDAIIEI